MKRLKVLLILLSLAIISVLLISSCTVEAPKATEPAAQAVAPAAAEPVKKVKIGILTMGLSQPYFVALSQGYKDEAAKFTRAAVEVVEIDPKMDTAQQVAAIENFIQLKVDAFIITAIDPKTVDTAVKDAMKAGVKVIAHYNQLGAQDLLSAISTYGMGFVAGQEAAKWINEKLGGKANVALLVWDKTEFDIDRTKGMKGALELYAPGAKVVAEQAADAIVSGLSASESILQAHPDVKVFVCYNDEGCLGALQAVEAAGLNKAGDFGIFGVNASPEALTKIKDGTAFRGTASIDPYHHGILEMEMAIRLVLGDFLPSTMEIVPVPVSINNVASFIQ
jgi:ribose transport system substrate-binding protein